MPAATPTVWLPSVDPTDHSVWFRITRPGSPALEVQMSEDSGETWRPSGTMDAGGLEDTHWSNDLPRARGIDLYRVRATNDNGATWSDWAQLEVEMDGGFWLTRPNVSTYRRLFVESGDHSVSITGGGHTKRTPLNSTTPFIRSTPARPDSITLPIACFSKAERDELLSQLRYPGALLLAHDDGTVWSVVRDPDFDVVLVDTLRDYDSALYRISVKFDILAEV